MTAIYYDIMFSISLILTTVYAMLWHKHFDIHISLLFIFIPIANAGYVLTEYADTAEAAGTASKIVYLGGCFLMLFSMLAVLSLCHVEMPRIVRGLLIGIMQYALKKSDRKKKLAERDAAEAAAKKKEEVEE